MQSGSESGRWPDSDPHIGCRAKDEKLVREVAMIPLSRFRLTLISLLLGIVLLPVMAYASDGMIEKVQVTIVSQQPPPAKIMKRITASVATVGEQMLVGRSVHDVEDKKGSYEKLIQEIFDRVLVGYQVQSVTIEPGENATITVEIAPWGDTVQEVVMEYDFGNLSPEVVNLLRNDMGNVEEKVKDMLLGLPVEAVDWAGGLSKVAARDVMASQLPEFHANMDIVPGGRTVVKLSLSPVGPTVQNVHVALRSQTIPNIVLAMIRPAMNETSRILIGLPVAFVERHLDYFTARLVAEQPLTQKYGMTATPQLLPGTDSEIALNVETTKYKVTLEAYLDMGHAEDNVSARLHAGKFIGSRDEAFLEVNFIPGTVSWELVPGWGHRIGSDTVAGMKFNTSNSQNVLWLQQHLTPHWTMRLERTVKTGDNELGLRYKLHDFLSAEYIIGKDDRWLRLVGHL